MFQMLKNKMFTITIVIVKYFFRSSKLKYFTILNITDAAKKKPVGTYSVINYPETSSSQRYEGHILEEQPWGNGSMLFRNGETYSGSWKFGMFDGFGKFDFLSNDSLSRKQYEGEWKVNVQWGKGTMTFR